MHIHLRLDPNLQLRTFYILAITGGGGEYSLPSCRTSEADLHMTALERSGVAAGAACEGGAHRHHPARARVQQRQPRFEGSPQSPADFSASPQLVSVSRSAPASPWQGGDQIACVTLLVRKAP